MNLKNSDIAVPVSLGVYLSPDLEEAALMNRKADDGHGIVAELLPWYVNGTLGSKEQEWVAGHLSDCPRCHLELKHYQQLSSAIPDVGTEAMDWKPSPAHFGQILSALDAEKNGVIRNVTVVKKPSFLGQCADWLQAQAKPLVWALALETIVLAALVLFVVLPRVGQQAPGQAVFQTLSDAHAPTVAGQPRLHIVFADDMAIADLHLLLVSVNAQLVDGPSMLGVYTVELATVGNPDALAQAIATLRKHPKVKLAEPVHP